jgi:hypothetical protein
MTAFKASSARSQSSVQLLGYIESCMHVDIQETTDEGELRVKGYETLLNTSTSVLSCIQVSACTRQRLRMIGSMLCGLIPLSLSLS